MVEVGEFFMIIRQVSPGSKSGKDASMICSCIRNDAIIQC